MIVFASRRPVLEHSTSIDIDTKFANYVPGSQYRMAGKAWWGNWMERYESLGNRLAVGIPTFSY